jgi:hypothetical protein
MNKLLAIFVLCGAVSGYGQTFDGPAELPRTVMTTTVASTPSPNVPKVVGPEMNLQTALNSAVCGDTIQVDPAIIYTGSLQLPSLPCDAQHWITITSSGALPDEFTRIKPTTSLPRIILPISNSAVRGGIFVRFVGFEITRLSGIGIIFNMISPGAGSHDLIFDRVYVHGTAIDETTRGLMLTNAYNVAVINSYFSDFHCLAIAGTCQDAQAIAGGLSTSVPDGNYKIVNNYLEAAGENIVLGGGAATFTPHDVTILYNDFNKPDSWNPADPSYAPIYGKDGLLHPWIVKNLLEFKNCQRCLVEGNRMSGNWGGFSQSGFAILLTPKNQSNACPICAVSDITIRNNHISKSGLALQLAVTTSDSGGWPSDSGRWSIHNNIFDRLSYSTCFACGQWLVQIGSNYIPGNTPVVLHDVSVDHNTFELDETFPTTSGGHGFLLLNGPSVSPKVTNVNFTNNVVPSGDYPIYFTGGGANNCAFGHLTNYVDMISNCWTGASSFTGNVVLTNGWNGKNPFPAGNFIVNSGANPAVVSSTIGLRKVN